MCAGSCRWAGYSSFLVRHAHSRGTRSSHTGQIFIAHGQTPLALPGQCPYNRTVPFRSMGVGEMDSTSSDRQGLKLVTVDWGIDHEAPRPLVRGPSEPIPLPT